MSEKCLKCGRLKVKGKVCDCRMCKMCGFDHGYGELINGLCWMHREHPGWATSNSSSVNITVAQ